MLKELTKSYSPVVALVTRKKITQETDLGDVGFGEHFVWKKELGKKLMKISSANMFSDFHSVIIVNLEILVNLEKLD